MVTTAMTIDVRSEAVTTAAQALSAAIAALDAIDPERLDDDALAATVRTVRTLGERLTARIARLSHAAVARALPEGHGARRPEVWLANLTGAAVATARRDLGVAAGLAEPRVAAAVEAGLASLDHARVLGTVTAHPAFAMHGAGLIDAAARVTPAQLTDQVELWRARHDGPVDLDARAHARRALTIRRNDDATAELWARLPTESMAVVEASLTALVDGQRTDGSERTRTQRYADALVALAGAHLAGTVSGGRAAGGVLVTVPADVAAGAPGRGELAGGGTVGPETIERLACDTRVYRVLTDQGSVPVDLGRGRRAATHHQWRALVVRDRGCVFPGCDRPPGWCQAHHWRDGWTEGGTTDLDNLALVCDAHHRLLHEGGWQLGRSTERGWYAIRPGDHRVVAGRGREAGAPETATPPSSPTQALRDTG